MGDPLLIFPASPKLIGIAADQGGFELKQHLTARLREAGHTVIDFGDRREESDDDYPDFVVAMARAVASGGSRARRGHLRERSWGGRGG